MCACLCARVTHPIGGVENPKPKTGQRKNASDLRVRRKSSSALLNTGQWQLLKARTLGL